MCVVRCQKRIAFLENSHLIAKSNLQCLGCCMEFNTHTHKLFEKYSMTMSTIHIFLKCSCAPRKCASFRFLYTKIHASVFSKPADGNTVNFRESMLVKVYNSSLKMHAFFAVRCTWTCLLGCVPLN